MHESQIARYFCFANYVFLLLSSRILINVFVWDGKKTLVHNYFYFWINLIFVLLNYPVCVSIIDILSVTRILYTRLFNFQINTNVTCLKSLFFCMEKWCLFQWFNNTVLFEHLVLCIINICKNWMKNDFLNLLQIWNIW